MVESIVEPLPREIPFMICASVKEMEFPHVVPHNFVLAGPILSPVPPVSDKTYPEMATFLSRKRTFVINMGSNFWYTVDDVANVANAIVIARERCGENCPFQVLWKLNGMKAFDTLLSAILEGMMDDVRMEEWIIPPTLAILQHANVAGFVNHGGASKYSCHHFKMVMSLTSIPQTQFMKLLSTSLPPTDNRLILIDFSVPVYRRSSYLSG